MQSEPIKRRALRIVSPKQKRPRAPKKEQVNKAEVVAAFKAAFPHRVVAINKVDRAQKPKLTAVKSNAGFLKENAVGRRFVATSTAVSTDGKIKVQVDAKTWLMISPDKNIDEVVGKYRARMASQDIDERRTLKF